MKIVQAYSQHRGGGGVIKSGCPNHAARADPITRVVVAGEMQDISLPEEDRLPKLA